MSFDMARPFNHPRHPELVSRSIAQLYPSVPYKALRRRHAISRASDETARWTLKRVQGDGVLGLVL
jgi:hypothetical protein